MLLPVSLVYQCIPGPAKRRLGLRELGQDCGPWVHPFPTIATSSSTYHALVKVFMDLKVKNVGKSELGASSEAEGWKNVLQLLKEQSEKMKKWARALSVIRQGMLRNNPRHVTDSVNKANEVLGGMLKTYKCLLEIPKKMESHPTMKNLGIFKRPRPASLGDAPKNQMKGEIRSAPSPLLEKTP